MPTALRSAAPISASVATGRTTSGSRSESSPRTGAGIGATAVLAVVERGPESGLLRAIGLSRGALAGATLGVPGPAASRAAPPVSSPPATSGNRAGPDPIAGSRFPVYS